MNAEHFVTDVLEVLNSTYFDCEGKPVTGQAVSSVLEHLRGCRGMPHTKSRRLWRGFRALADLEQMLREQGFTLVYGRNSRGQKTIIVTV